MGGTFKATAGCVDSDIFQLAMKVVLSGFSPLGIQTVTRFHPSQGEIKERREKLLPPNWVLCNFFVLIPLSSACKTVICNFLVPIPLPSACKTFIQTSSCFRVSGHETELVAFQCTGLVAFLCAGKRCFI